MWWAPPRRARQDGAVYHRAGLRQAHSGGGIPHYRPGRPGHPQLYGHGKTGPIVGIKVVDGTEDLLLVTEAGILIRTAVENIRIAGRATQGVIVMRFKEEGDRVISMALTDREQETEKE